MAAKQDITTRFSRYVDQENGPVLAHVAHLGRCWIWIGTRNPHGYGNFHVGRVSVLAHRLAWEMRHSYSAQGFFVLHHCDNPSCVNPVHLWLGTPADNVRDREWKKRGGAAYGDRNGSKTMPNRIRRGQDAPSAKLTTAQVLEIRALFAAGRPKKTLAKRYGVHRATIFSIVNRETWTHVPPAEAT